MIALATRGLGAMTLVVGASVVLSPSNGWLVALRANGEIVNRAAVSQDCSFELELQESSTFKGFGTHALQAAKAVRTHEHHARFAPLHSHPLHAHCVARVAEHKGQGIIDPDAAESVIERNERLSPPSSSRLS